MLYLSEMVIDREDEIRERKAAPRCPHILLSAGSYGIRAPFSDIITSYLLQAYASWLALIRASWPVTAPPSTTPSSPIYNLRNSPISIVTLPDHRIEILHARYLRVHHLYRPDDLCVLMGCAVYI